MPTPREERAAARDSRQQHLQVPHHGLGRGDLIRSRTPSPTGPGIFDFPRPAHQPSSDDSNNFADAEEEVRPASTMATQEQLDAIRDQLRNEIRAEVRNETAASAATVPDAIKRKPEIPPFDKKNVDHWIRRTENAFIRALCNTPREKFAFLETKFSVDFNPRINEYLWGDPTEDNWNAFIAYLRSEYGTTKQQRASVILDGFKRDGKRPSQYVALLDEKTKDINLEDVKKEMLVRELPTEVQRMLQERIDSLSLKDAAQFADAYFDQDGKPRQVNKSASVNAVQNSDSDFTNPFSDDGDDINAVNRRFPNQRNGGFNNFRRGGRGRPQQGPTQTPSRNPTPTPQPKPKPDQDPSLCFYHNEYGNKAKKCEVGCKRFDEKRFAGNGKAGQR